MKQLLMKQLRSDLRRLLDAVDAGNRVTITQVQLDAVVYTYTCGSFADAACKLNKHPSTVRNLVVAALRRYRDVGGHVEARID
jgi:hypothetical protein